MIHAWDTHIKEKNGLGEGIQGDSIVQLILLQKINEKVQGFLMSDQIMIGTG